MSKSDVKGILTYKTVRFTKTHDIAKISSDLTPDAVANRYQDALINDLTEAQVLEALALSKNVYSELTSLISRDYISTIRCSAKPQFTFY